jgi:hypothetical protein
MTRRVIDGSAEGFEDVPTRLLSSGAVGFCDLLTCAPHVNAVLVRTEALRAVGGFDADIEHFDDWAAWLRIADRETATWRIAETVAEWRLHSNGLSGSVLRNSSMKRRIRSLFAHLQNGLSEENARAVAKARRILAAHDVATYDDYVHAVAGARDRLHETGSCFGRRLQWHAVPEANFVLA